MKTSFLAILLFCSVAASAQGIKTSEYDSITKTRHIETTAKWVNKGLGGGFAIALKLQDNALLVELSVFPAFEGLMSAGDPLMFQLDNDSMIVAQAKGTQLRSKNYKVPYEYYITLKDIKTLRQLPTKAVRFYSAGGYKDNKIAVQDQKDIQKVCEVFLQEYEKKAGANNSASGKTAAH
jgi:hypothetical protein